jgi:hypothetical protein
MQDISARDIFREKLGQWRSGLVKLAWGAFSLSKGGSYYDRRNNECAEWRIICSMVPYWCRIGFLDAGRIRNG